MPAPGFTRTFREGLIDGLPLASTILGSILVVGTLAVLVPILALFTGLLSRGGLF